MENNRKNKLICILFALFFAFGFFLCVLLPKKEYSYSERRKLHNSQSVPRKLYGTARLCPAFTNIPRISFLSGRTFADSKHLLPQKFSAAKTITASM